MCSNHGSTWQLHDGANERQWAGFIEDSLVHLRYGSEHQAAIIQPCRRRARHGNRTGRHEVL